jgi:HEAT repeat protein
MKYGLLFCFVLLLFTDCRCQRDNLTVSKVIVEIPENIANLSQEYNIDIKKIMSEALDSDGKISVKSNSDNGVLTIALAQLERGFTLIASLEHDAQEQLAFAEIDIEPQRCDVNCMKKALNKALYYLRQQLSGIDSDSEAFLSRLKEAAAGEIIEPRLLLNAIKQAIHKKSQEALDPLIVILSSTENLGIANACLTALAELKDPSSLPAIIDFAEGKPALIRRQAIIAVRQIPAKLGLEWLVAMAYGHNDPMVRKEALEASQEVEVLLSEHN